jgi:hypothetical protein
MMRFQEHSHRFCGTQSSAEFGPGALIYHEGARYRVYKVNLDFGSQDIEATHELTTATMKRCPRCGYAHLEQGNNLTEVCDRCGAALDGPARIESLVQLQNVSLRVGFRHVISVLAVASVSGASMRRLCLATRRPIRSAAKLECPACI